MTLEHLLIDIETLLKMVRFLPSFKEYFVKNKYLTQDDLLEVTKYVENANILSKEHLWAFCSVLEHVIEINILIKQWRGIILDYSKVESDIRLKLEKEYTYDIVGRLIKTEVSNEKFGKLIKELQHNKFYYNGLSTITTRLINKDTNTAENCRLHFFF